MAAPVIVSATHADAARPGVAIEDVLVRLLPAMEDQSIARELRPLLNEAQRQVERNVPLAKEQALDRVRARLREIEANQENPDLDAVMLALVASR
jgi:hypothetical protein